MAEAFICDFVAHAVRPLRRRAEGCAHRRPRRTPDPRAEGAQPRPRSGKRSTTSSTGCANQAGEDNRNVARMALLLAGLPERIPGATINRLCGSGLDAVGTRSAGHPRGRRGPDDRGRRGEHDARAVRHGQGQRGVLAHGRDLRHHDRLALRQPRDARALRHRFDAGDGGERRRGVPGHARGPGRVRLPIAATRQGRAGCAASSRARSRRSRCRRARERHRGRPRRAPAPRHHAGGPGEAEGAVPQGRAGRSPRATRRASTTARRR